MSEDKDKELLHIALDDRPPGMFSCPACQFMHGSMLVHLDGWRCGFCASKVTKVCGDGVLWLKTMKENEWALIYLPKTGSGCVLMASITYSKGKKKIPYYTTMGSAFCFTDTLMGAVEHVMKSRFAIKPKLA